MTIAANWMEEPMTYSYQVLQSITKAAVAESHCSGVTLSRSSLTVAVKPSGNPDYKEGFDQT